MLHPNQNSKPNLLEAIRVHWKNLIGIAIFPPATFIGVEILHIPALIFVPFFFAALGIAGWPYLTRRAPYMFWIIALGVWMGAAVIGITAVQIIRALANSQNAVSSSKSDH
jgi:hypothetical protein